MADTETPPEPKRLSGGNPQIAKGQGDGPLQAWIAAAPGWKSETAAHVDALIVRALPDVTKQVKWNSPMYGMEGQGMFLGLHVFARYLKVAFFTGTALEPAPPGASKQAKVRYLDIHEGDVLDEAQFTDWVVQASRMPGETM